MDFALFVYAYWAPAFCDAVTFAAMIALGARLAIAALD